VDEQQVHQPAFGVVGTPLQGQQRTACLDLQPRGEDRVGQRGRQGLLDLREVDAGAAEQLDARRLREVLGVEGLVRGARPGHVVAERHAVLGAHAHRVGEVFVRVEVEQLAHRVRRAGAPELHHPDFGMLAEDLEVLEQAGQWCCHRLRLVAVDHVGAAAAAALDQAFGSEFVERALGGDARDVERLGQLELGRHLRAVRQFATDDAVT